MNNLIGFISENLLIFQAISFSASAILLSFIIYFIVRLGIVGEKIEDFIDVLSDQDISKRRTLKVWKQIQKRLKIGESNQLKLAILEADRVLFEILKMSGYQGKNLDEIFEQITEAQIPNIKEIQQVHKLRNRISAEPDFNLTQNETEVAIEIYKKAFQELKLIE